MSYVYVTDEYRLHAAPVAIRKRIERVTRDRNARNKELSELAHLATVRAEQMGKGEWPDETG